MRRRQEHTSPEVDLGIIITPMLDMAFQLLAFFIMTYKPSLYERHIDGNLLPAIETVAKGENDPTKDDKPPSEIDARQFPTVRVQTPEPGQQITRKDRGGKDVVIHHGEPSQIWVKRVQSPSEEGVCDEDDLLDVKTGMDKLTRELTRIRSQDPGEQKGINLVADGELRFEFVILVQDACRRAGYTSVNFIAPGDEKKSPGP